MNSSMQRSIAASYQLHGCHRHWARIPSKVFLGSFSSAFFCWHWVVWGYDTSAIGYRRWDCLSSFSRDILSLPRASLPRSQLSTRANLPVIELGIVVQRTTSLSGVAIHSKKCSLAHKTNIRRYFLPAGDAQHSGHCRQAWGALGAATGRTDAAAPSRRSQRRCFSSISMIGIYITIPFYLASSLPDQGLWLVDWQPRWWYFLQRSLSFPLGCGVHTTQITGIQKYLIWGTFWAQLGRKQSGSRANPIFRG